MPHPVIYLARHATPDWNRVDIPYEIPPGPPLVAQGEREAEQLAEWLSGRNVQRIYASPMLRTQQTAIIVGRRLQLPVIEAPDMTEARKFESRADVGERVWRFYKSLQNQPGPLVVVSHGSPINALLQKLGVSAALLEQLRQRFDHHNPSPPAGVWALTPRGCELAFVPELAVEIGFSRPG